MRGESEEGVRVRVKTKGEAVKVRGWRVRMRTESVGCEGAGTRGERVGTEVEGVRVKVSV